MNDDPTPTGDSTTAGPPPSPHSYTIQDLVQAINNGAQWSAAHGPQHPQYQQVRALMNEAHQHLSQRMADLNAGDQAGAQLDPRTSFMENLAQGASMGIGTALGG